MSWIDLTPWCGGGSPVKSVLIGIYVQHINNTVAWYNSNIEFDDATKEAMESDWIPS
jgi:hypothetical protein